MLKLKIELMGTEASRVVMVPENCTLEGLHEVIQGLFDWDNSHLWSFTAKNDMYWEPPSDYAIHLFDSEPQDPSETCIGSVLTKKGNWLLYTYDFGDNWGHRITRMTDPKEGTAYGCVKTVGPDGVEDCGGPFALAEETLHQPTLGEINRRIPKAVKTGEYVPPINTDRPDSLTVRDIVASKDIEVLRFVVEPDEPFPPREVCIERSVKLLDKHPDSLKLFLIGLTDYHYEVMIEALKTGVGTLNTSMGNDVGIFEGYPFVYVEQRGRGRYRIITPPKLREIWRKFCTECALLHVQWNEIHRYATAAARLYGSMSVHDFVALLDKYKAPGVHVEKLVAYVLQIRSYSGCACHVISGPDLRWGDFADDEDGKSEFYSDFVTRRLDVPRWEPRSKDEFLAYGNVTFIEDIESVRILQTFLSKRCGKNDLPDILLREIIGHLICGDTPGEIVAGFSKRTFPDKDVYSEKLRALIADVRENIRLPIYNGHTNQELCQLGMK